MPRKQFAPPKTALPLYQAACRYAEHNGRIVELKAAKDSLGLMARLKQGLFETSDRTYQWWGQPSREQSRREIQSVFGRVVASGRVTLCARRNSASAPFEPLPSNLWPHLTVTSWVKGEATASGGTRFLEVHASIQSGRKRGRPPKVDLDNGIRQAAFELLDRYSGRGAKAKVEKLLLGKRGMSESTARVHATNLIAEWERQKAGK